MASGYFPRFSALAAAILLACAGLFPAAPAAEVLIENDYVFDASTDGVRAFIGDDPGELVFESDVSLDAEIDFDWDVYGRDNADDGWNAWHEAGAPAGPDAVDDYRLAPLSALTIGSGGYNLVLGDGAMVVNTGDSDGIIAMRAIDMDIGENAVVHGTWAGISLENFLDGNHGEIVNRGRIGSFVDDRDGDDPVSRESEFGVWVYRVGDNDVFVLKNEAQGEIEGVFGGVQVERGSGAGFVDIDNAGAIRSENTGVSVGSVDPEYIWLMRPDFINYFEGAFELKNEGVISGGSIGVDVLGSDAKVNIDNRADGVIESGNTAVRIFDGGGQGAARIENHGRISGGETGISVLGGTVDIENHGEISGGADGDAIVYDGGATGGEITLYSGVQGAIRHLGDSGGAALFLMDGGADASVGDIVWGEGSITQSITPDSGDAAWSFGGDVSAGSLAFAGGEAVLGGVVSIGGAITVSDNASLSIDGAVIESEDLDIASGAGFDFNHGSVTINGGSFNYGAGPLTLSGQSDDREAGLHLKDGKASTSTGGIDVAEHGRLGGTGTVEGDVSADAGGTLQPGDPTGQLSISGDLAVDGGAVVNIRIMGGDDNCGKLSVVGEADIKNGATLRIEDVSAGAVRDDATYTFMSAGTLTLDGDDPFTIDHDSLLYDFMIPYEDGYDTNAGEIRFIADRLADYSDEAYADTANRKAVARALESARQDRQLENLTIAYEGLLSDILHEGVSESDMQAALEQLNPEPYQAAFRMTSGQAHAMARRTMHSARQSRLKMATGTGDNLAQNIGAMLSSSFSAPGFDAGAVGRALDAWAGPSAGGGSGGSGGYSGDYSGGRARIVHDEMGVSAPDSPWRGFYGAYGQLGEIDADAGRSGYDFRSGGLIIGAERSVSERLVAGASIGYGTGSADFDENDGELEMRSLRIGPHATWVGRNMEVDVAASAGVHLNRQERRITIPVDANPSSRFLSYDGSVFTEARYRVNLARTWDIVPAASLHYAWQYRESHTERGAGDAALAFDSQSDHFLRSRLGLSVLRPFSGRTFVVVPEVFAGWGYELLDEDIDVKASFANAPGSGFRVTGDGPGRHSAIYGGGISALFGEYNVIFARYEREDLEEGGVDTFSLGVKWNF